MPIALGIDIGGTRVKAALVNADGQILRAAQIASAPTLSQFREELTSMAVDLQKDQPPIAGAGIGCKGIIEASTTKIVTLPGNLNHLEGQDLSALLKPALPPNCRVFADNDARVAFAGEIKWGAARNTSDAILLTLGTGVGGAILSNGKLLQGARGIAGHIGHFTVDPDGVDCICGNHGCLETVFSARAIESEARAAIHRGVACQLLDSAAPVSCERVFACARNNDPVSQRIVLRASKVLAAAIATLVFILDPEKVILSGQIIDSSDMLLDFLRADVYDRTKSLLKRRVPIVKSELTDPSGVIGAAALVFKDGN